MKKFSKLVTGIALIALSSVVLAENPLWKSQAELGLVLTSGNTDISTINAKIDATREEGSWRHNLHAEVLNSVSAGVISAQKRQTSGQSDYKFNETDYAFGLLNYEDYKFSGFEYQVTVSGGYGRRVLDENQMILDVEIGPGIRFSKATATQQTENDPLLRVAAKYNWAISENATFAEDLSADIGSDLTITKSVTSLQANINSTLAMKMTFTVKNNSVVPVGTKKTDTETAVTLVYSF